MYFLLSQLKYTKNKKTNAALNQDTENIEDKNWTKTERNEITLLREPLVDALPILCEELILSVPGWFQHLNLGRNSLRR